MIKFQSLLGFLMRCAAMIPAHHPGRLEVSIPAGFSDALRRACTVSLEMPLITFQSLLGFLMRCDQYTMHLGEC